MFTADFVKGATRLSDENIRYVLTVCLHRKVEGPVTSGELLCLLVFDLLKGMGFSVEHLTAILLHCGERLIGIGKVFDLAKPGDEIEFQSLQILDNRWVVMNEEVPYDFTKMEPAPQSPLPVLSLAVALPRLYQLAISASAPAPRQRSSGATKPDRKSGDASG